MKQQDIINSKKQVSIDKMAANATLKHFSEEVVTHSSSNRLLSNKLNNFINNFFMEKKIYLGVAILVVALVASLGMFMQKGGNSKTAQTVKDPEVETIAQSIDEVSNELDAVLKEIDDLEASFSTADIDAAMKDLESIK